MEKENIKPLLTIIICELGFITGIMFSLIIG